MRHGKKVNHLGRTSSHRRAMLSNMASSLIMSKKISTTVAKAKALRKYVEPLITKAKKDETHSRREVFSYLQNKVAVTELFREISAKVGDRPGGYTRILRTGFRMGDAAEMCIIELVDFNENYSQNKGNKKAKAKATRRGGGAKKVTPAKTEEHSEEVISVEETVEETPVQEVEAHEEVAVEEVAVETVEEPVEETPAQPVEEVVAEVIAQPEAVIAEEAEEQPAAEAETQETEQNKEN